MDDKTAQTKTILLVEDELPFRQIYKDAFLNMLNYRVVEAENGEEALEVIHEQPPDIVLLDLVLPKLSGFDVLAQIKNDPNYKHIPVVVYSVIDQKSEVERAMKLGASDFTIKGMTPAAEVVEKVKKLLGE
ncbi:MAG TPA: response regulator [Candidatus Saccharimonadales bacterium]|nr:response regulator [Candidatus Saccharimonadales bacterium]